VKFSDLYILPIDFFPPMKDVFISFFFSRLHKRHFVYYKCEQGSIKVLYPRCFDSQGQISIKQCVHRYFTVNYILMAAGKLFTTRKMNVHYITLGGYNKLVNTGKKSISARRRRFSLRNFFMSLRLVCGRIQKNQCRKIHLMDFTMHPH